MSALPEVGNYVCNALFASYLSGCDGIFHVLVKGNEFELTSEYGV